MIRSFSASGMDFLDVWLTRAFDAGPIHSSARVRGALDGEYDVSNALMSVPARRAWRAVCGWMFLHAHKRTVDLWPRILVLRW